MQDEVRGLTRNGIWFKSLLYDSAELAELRRKEGPDLRVYIRIDENDIGSIDVTSRKSPQVCTVPALYQDYARGVSLVLHEVICEYRRLRRENKHGVEGWQRATSAIALLIDESRKLTHEKLHATQQSRGAIAASCSSEKLITTDGLFYRFRRHTLSKPEPATCKAKRSFQVAHIEHILTESGITDAGAGSRPRKLWLTIMVDEHNWRLLAHHKSFDPPSAMSCIQVIRDCIFLQRRVPKSFVIDGGMQFRSIHLETFCALHGASIEVRSCFDPRCRGGFERLFGMSIAQLIATLGGDAQILMNVRRAIEVQDPTGLTVSRVEGRC